MKTFLIVTLYAGMVAALDLGGAVWNQLHDAHPTKAGVAVVAPAVPIPAKGGSANSAVATNPSDT